jgi:hypothetical protein
VGDVSLLMMGNRGDPARITAGRRLAAVAALALCLTAGGLVLPLRLNVSAAAPLPINLDQGGPQQATVVCQQSPYASVSAPNFPTKGCGTGPGYCQKYGGPGAYPAYGYDNVWACSPSNTIDNTPFDVNDGNSFQCVDLSARFLWAVDGQWAGQGVSYYGQNLVTDVYNEYFPDLSEGTTAAGNSVASQTPTPGDVISFGPGPAVAPEGVGHTAVVVASDPLNGTFTIMSENMTNDDGDGTAGVQYLEIVPNSGSQVTRTTTNAQGQTVENTSVTHEGEVRFKKFGLAQAEWLDEANPATAAASPTPAAGALQIKTPNTATSPPNATVGQPYGENLEASGPGDEAALYKSAGQQLYFWSIASGSLPEGLSLSSNGTIAGTPTQASQGGPFTVEVKADGQTAEQPFTIWANAPPVVKGTLQITTPSTQASPPNSSVGQPYSFTFAAKGGKGGYKWSIGSGKLPAGLTLSSGGVVSGKPTKASMGPPFTVKVTSGGQSAQTAFTIWAVAPPKLEIVAPDGATSPPNAVVGKRYSLPFTAIGGTGTYRWTLISTGVAGDGLPPGLKLSGSGVVSGIPLKVASAGTFTLKVISGNDFATKRITIKVVPHTVLPTVSACSLLTQAQVVSLLGTAPLQTFVPVGPGTCDWWSSSEQVSLLYGPTSWAFISRWFAHDSCSNQAASYLGGVGSKALTCPGEIYVLSGGTGVELTTSDLPATPSTAVLTSLEKYILNELGL